MARRIGPSAAGVSRLNQYAWSIASAIDAGGTVQEIWNAVKGAAQLAPGETLGASIFDMNYVAGSMRALLNGRDTMAAAPLDAAITSDMWGWAPWAEVSQAAMLQPRWSVRFETLYTLADGAEGSVWRSWNFTGSIEGLTVGDIQNQVDQTAQIMAGPESTSPLTPEGTIERTVRSSSIMLIRQ